MAPAERLDLAHENAHDCLLNSRDHFSLFISTFKNLRSIGLDFTNAYCPLGCCRALELCWDLVMEHAEKTRVFGLGDAMEKAKIMEHFMEGIDSTVEETDQRYQIEFVVNGS
jgi:hypothetical protein